MKRARHTALVDKSIEACIAAIEIYNKPDFRYREEAFSILMFNAWELLLKARVLKESRNKPRSIEIWEPRKKKDGSNGKRLTRRLSRSGNPMTIEALKCATIVQRYITGNIDEACIDNLELLAEVRDTCIHLRVVGPGLGKRIQEVGSASLRNYVKAAEDWFKVDLSRYNFFLMPLAFHGPVEAVTSLLTEQRPEAKKLLEYISAAEKRHASNDAGAFNVTLQFEMKFLRTPHPEAIAVRYASDGIPVTITEADVRNRYPWSYDALTKKLLERYTDFVRNRKYHGVRKGLEGEEKYCHTRLLNPADPRSGRKRFYSPNIVTEFDKHYARR